MIKNVSDADFHASVSAEGVTLVDFGAVWCPPCKALLPILEQLNKEFDDRVTILKIDADDSPATAAEFSVMSMPTVIAFKDGEPVEKLVGLRPISVYRNAITKYEGN